MTDGWVDVGRGGGFCLITARCQPVTVGGVLEKSVYHPHHSKTGSSKIHQWMLSLSGSVEEQDICVLLKALPHIAY